jgi:predicted phage terminase large subunit-like protein
MIINEQQAKQELERRIAAKDSLLAFTEYTHYEWQTGEHHRTICEHLEAIERGDIRRLIITAPPRHTKSELASRRFPAWYMGRNPNKQMITATYAAEFAGDFGRDVRGIVNSPEYQNIFSTRLAADSRAAGRWNTNQGGMYIATGVGGPITGRGADIALLDDYVKNRQDADSEKLRQSAWDWFTSTFYTRLMPGGAIVIIATRWHEDDLIGRCLNQDHEDWQLIELKAIENGKALWPEWYPLEDLERIKSTLGTREWEALYQQDPQPESGTYFKREWFNRYDTAPDAVNVYITTDFAVSEDGGDYTELGVWGVDRDDNLYALDWWSGQETADVWIDKLLDLQAKWIPMRIWGESGVIRRAVEPFLNKRCRERSQYAYFDWITRTADKSAMARTFQARCSMGKVFFPKTPWADRVVNQCVGFPSGKHDDAVDVCALIGLALNETHPGYVPLLEKRHKPDRWDRAFDRQDESTHWMAS